MTPVSTLQFVLNLAGAGCLGALVGLERQWHQRTAGTRTNALVAAGAAAFVMAGSLIGGDASSSSRVASFVVSGVGFLGAGVIFKDGASVHGLNTAATIWCSASIGLLAGLGALDLAVILSAAVLITNLALPPLIDLFHFAIPAAGFPESRYEISITCLSVDEIHLRALLLIAIGRTTATLQAIHRVDELGTSHARLRTEIRTRGRQNQLIEEIAARLSIEPAVTSLTWTAKPAALK